ncbi:IST1-like protein, partial [Tanacetum coccineum]
RAKRSSIKLAIRAPRCGEFPELQEIRVVLTARYGKEFANGAIDLRNNYGVNDSKTVTPKIKLRDPNEDPKRDCSERTSLLTIDDFVSFSKQGEDESKTNVIETNSSVSADDFDEVLSFTESRKGRNQYRNAEDAAQDAFESVAYAAAAARATVELS